MSEPETQVEAEPKQKRRGRPPGTKTRKRHDPEPAPVDGDYQLLDVVGKQPGYTYVALSDRDRQRRGHMYEVERWSETCAHSPWETFSPERKGQEVKINGQLTLMRIPTARDEARKKRERDAFRAAKDGITAADEGRGHRPTARSVVTHNVNVAPIY